MTDPPSSAAKGVADGLPVALDAMGGDRAPGDVVEGAALACEQGHGPIVLVGDEARIRSELDRLGDESLPIDVVHASEVIGMSEHPGRAARTKRDSSVHVGFRLVKQKQACGFVSAGNSGAVVAVGLLTLRRIARCDRPAIASLIPTRTTPTVLLDMGANVECRSSHLAQFALMGAAFAEIELDKRRPTVALLANGAEPTKGTEALREAHRLLTATDLNYVGFIEGRDLPQGVADVVVTDGFVGNVALKLSEGIALALVDRLQELLSEHWLGFIGAMLMKKSIRRLQGELDWVNTGGAPLLGIDGIGVVAHGGSPARAIANAVGLARGYVRADLVGKLGLALENTAAPDERVATAEIPITRSSGEHLPS